MVVSSTSAYLSVRRRVFLMSLSVREIATYRIANEIDPPCRDGVKETPPHGVRQHEEMRVSLGIEDAPVSHRLIVFTSILVRKPLVASRPGQQAVQATRQSLRRGRGSVGATSTIGADAQEIHGRA